MSDEEQSIASALESLLSNPSAADTQSRFAAALLSWLEVTCAVVVLPRPCESAYYPYIACLNYICTLSHWVSLH
jgi:hypothetical protein